MEFIDQFQSARRVSTPLVAIKTFDATSTLTHIKGALSDVSNTPILQWDAIHGLRNVNNAGVDALAKICNGIDQVATTDLTLTLAQCEAGGVEDALIFVSNAHLFWKEPAIIQAVWNLRNAYKASGNMLILLCSSGATLPAELVNDVLMLDEPLPDVDTLREIITSTYQYAKLPEPDAETINKATDALIGLPAFAAEQAVAMCISPKTKTLDLAELWDRKRQIINQTPGLSVWSGKETMDDIGGLANIKTYLHQLMSGKNAPKLILFMDEVEKAFAGTGTDMSGVKTELTGSMLSWTEDYEIDGLLWLGVPGAAKSALSKAMGGTYGIPVINFNIGDMQSGIVGSSGDNLRTAQKTVVAISGGSAGAKPRILMIATCNSIANLPGELLSRFKLGTFFFDAPDATERAAIWKIYRAKYEIPENDPTPNDAGWTGREIKECAYKAWRMNLTLSQAAAYVVPVTKSSKSVIDELRTMASGKYLSATKPGTYQFNESTMPGPGSFPVQVDGRKMREMN